MSLALHLAADALSDLRRLDPWLQEEVLDEIERLAAAPESIPAPLQGWGSVHPFVRVVGGQLQVITLTLERNDSRGLLIVLGVASATGGQGPTTSP